MLTGSGYTPCMNTLVAAALATNQANLALGNEVLHTPGGRFVRNVATPDVYDANFIDTITAASAGEIDALLARAEHAYAHGRHLRFDVDPRTPPEFEARLRLMPAFTCTEMLVLLLDDELRVRPKPFAVREVVNTRDWQAFAALHAANWIEFAGSGSKQERPADDSLATVMLESLRRKSPPVRYWLGYDEGAPCAYLSSWEGTNGVGQVESLYVLPAFRHRGLATTLLAHCVVNCRAHGAGPVAIVADMQDTPKQMYVAMGWRPVAVKRQFLRLC